MNFSNYRITLDIQKSKTQASIPVHYKDTGNRLYITLTDGGNPYIIPDGCQAVFVANRPNPETNPPLINDCIIENNSVVRYDFNNKTASVEGMHKCEIRIIGPNHEIITTPSFVMVVDQRVVYDDVIADDDEIAAITALGIIASEEARVGAENIRKQREELRQKNETDRISAEGVRKTEELERQSKERSRVSFEAARVTAENARVKAENARASTMSRLGKQVSNLVSQINGELIVTDTNVAYTKEVPARSAPYAEITKFGGMTYKTKNLFNPQWLLNTGYNVTITNDGFYRGDASWFYAAYGQAPAQLPITGFKENTSYTIQFEGYSENLSVATLGFQFYYTDGTSNYSPFITGTTNKKYSVVTDSNKTLQKILMTYSDGDYVYLRNICIKEGVSTDYEPFFEGFRHAKPTAFRTIGANVFDISKVTYGKNCGGDAGIPYRAVSAILPHKYPTYIKVNNLPSNMRYEINYHSANEYSYDAFVAASGWIEDTEVHTTGNYANGDYIIILFGTKDNVSEVTKADIEAMQLQVSYIDFDSYSPYKEISFPISTEVQKLPDWGVGYQRAYNYVDWDAKKYHKRATKGIISNVFKTSGVYGNIHYFGFSKPTNFEGYNDTSRSFIIEGFETRSSSGDWDNVAWIGTATGEASYTDMWVGFPAGTTLEEAKAALEGKEWIYVLKNEEVTDIPDLPDDNLIPVEGGGTIIAENDYNYDVPSEITYQLRRAN